MNIKKSAPVEETSVDLRELYEKYIDKYSSVYIQDFGPDGVFIYKTLGRKDFRDLINTKELDDCAKEEIICESCVLYPENYDFENCEQAGLPTELAQVIIEHSLLKSSDQLKKAIHYYRDELANSLDDQITCIIHEAFPEFTIEEIANWDVTKTADYMTRSEYILNRLRGVPITPVNEEPQQEPIQYQQAPKPEPKPEPKHEEYAKENEMNLRNHIRSQQEQRKESVQKSDGKLLHKGDKLTPQMLAELQRRYPDIDWAHDAARQRGVDAFRGQYFDDRPVAEIPIDDMNSASQEDLPIPMRKRFKVIGTLD